MADLDFLDFNSDSRPVVYVLRDEDLRKFAASLIKAGRKEREQEIRDESTSDIYYTRAEGSVSNSVSGVSLQTS